MRYLSVILVIGLFAGTSWGDDPASAWLNAQRGILQRKPLTPEEQKQQEEARAKAKAQKEALAITVENQPIRIWHKGKDPQVQKVMKGRTSTTTKTKPTQQPIQAKLIKIYPDSVILEKKDSTTLEIKRKDLIKVDRDLIDKLAEKTVEQ